MRAAPSSLLALFAAASAAELDSVPLRGDFDELAYKFISVRVGSRAQPVRVIADTGSSLLAFPCEGCEPPACPSSHTRFVTSNSSSAEVITCRAVAEAVSPSHTCAGCGAADECLYTRSYAEGSALEGRYVRDDVALGDSTKVRTTFGCHTRETGLFSTQEVDGILGLAAGGVSLPAALGGAPFSLCTVRRGGVLTLGGTDTRLRSVGAKSALTTLRVLDDGFYRVRVASLQVVPAPCGGAGDAEVVSSTEKWRLADHRTGARLRGGGGGSRDADACAGNVLWGGPWPSGGDMIIDSGSSYTYIPRAAMEVVIEAVQLACWGAPAPAGGAFEDAPGARGAYGCNATRVPELALPSGQVMCVRAHDGAAIATLPAIELALEGGSSWRIDPEDAFMRTPWTAGLFCLQIFPAEEVGGRVVLGTNAMLGKDIGFFLKDGWKAREGRLTWVASACTIVDDAVRAAVEKRGVTASPVRFAAAAGGGGGDVDKAVRRNRGGQNRLDGADFIARGVRARFGASLRSETVWAVGLAALSAVAFVVGSLCVRKRGRKPKVVVAAAAAATQQNNSGRFTLAAQEAMSPGMRSRVSMV